MRRSSFPVAASQRWTLFSPPEARSLPSGEKATEKTDCCPASSRRTSFPFSGSQKRMVSSWLPEVSILPSGEKATESTGFSCPWSRCSSLPPATSQILTVLSSPPAEANALPSGENATDFPHWCPCRRRISLPVDTSHKQTPCPPEPRIRPSGEKAREWARDWFSPNLRISRLVARSHKRMVLPSPPEASILPSGE